MSYLRLSLVACLSLPLLAGCTDSEAGEADEAERSETSAEGDGDGDPGDGDGDSTGDGDGDSGDGDGDSTGDGDGDSTGDGDGDSAGDGDGDLDCVPPLGIQPLPPDFEQPEDPTAPGSTWAYFELEDFQPQSCNFGEVYSLETFKGEVTLVMLARATCEICQGTIEKLEQMKLELTLAGHTVHFVAINQAGYQNAQQELIDRASFQLLQDTADADAWDLMNEPMFGTDDLYIYDREGLLHSYFSYADANPSIDLHTDAGWDTVYNALIAALES